MHASKLRASKPPQQKLSPRSPKTCEPGLEIQLTLALVVLLVTAGDHHGHEGPNPKTLRGMVFKPNLS